MVETSKLQVTREELDSLVRAGVQEAKLEILIRDFQEHKNGEETRWAEMFALVRQFPDKVSDCKDEMEQDFHDELENHYATKADMRLLKQSLEGQINQVSNKFKWTVAVIVAVAGVIQFVVSMTYITRQLTNLLGGSA